MQNSAFVFIKPHANTPEAQKIVKSTLEAKKMTIKTEGSISGKDIDEKQLIDNHYYAIASKATILTPAELNVPKPKFQEKFGADWDTTLGEGKIFNAKQACEYLGVDANGLNTQWAAAKSANKLVKFGGGFYCALIDTVQGKDPCYVMNGFFMSMRTNFIAPDASIYYFVVEWDPRDLTWADFRGLVLGPTDPAEAPADSLRGMFMKNWSQYKLKGAPNVGDNAVHASASPFEALAEKMNWLQMSAAEDPFGAAVQALLGDDIMTEWSRDAQVIFGEPQIQKSIFDLLEDTDVSTCRCLLGMVLTHQDMGKLNAYAKTLQGGGGAKKDAAAEPKQDAAAEPKKKSKK